MEYGRRYYDDNKCYDNDIRDLKQEIYNIKKDNRNTKHELDTWADNKFSIYFNNQMYKDPKFKKNYDITMFKANEYIAFMVKNAEQDIKNKGEIIISNIINSEEYGGMTERYYRNFSDKLRIENRKDIDTLFALNTLSVSINIVLLICVIYLFRRY